MRLNVLEVALKVKVAGATSTSIAVVSVDSKVKLKMIVAIQNTSSFIMNSSIDAKQLKCKTLGSWTLT